MWHKMHLPLSLRPVYRLLWRLCACRCACRCDSANRAGKGGDGGDMYLY